MATFSGPDKIMSLHYASFFYMLRDFDNSERLTSGKVLKINIDEYEELVHDGVTYLVKDGFGISEKLARYLSGDITQKIPTFKSYSDGEMNIMADGTLMKKNAMANLFSTGLKDMLKDMF